MGKVERAFASTFFGKPPESSFDEALKYFLESDKGKHVCALPISSLVEGDHAYTVGRIAQCYNKLGNKAAARQWAEKALKLHAQDSESQEILQDCQRILK